MDVVDQVAKRREEEKQLEELANRLNEGNRSLVKTFWHLTHIAETAAAAGDLDTVSVALETIDQLAEIGVTSKSVQEA